ncbi:hypothetical protein RHGRI_018814 [Rhododendron griersonianum]|uniref:25S rRNA (uridine-N(3))-methyltransferase BMT5-like domain-containing protein n=1 Tax=Rhododendron griersonianum TaxID=479676 RepID=A0AAV6K2U3_9ERIC|nr:hypothetical protein RHGRI_018814 [Rhododendron griersonianum]
MAIGIEHDEVIIAEEEEREIWAKHYCSSHQILLVGEGDFSFSLSLAHSFGSASNILASSLDSYDVLIKKYKQAKSNLEKLGLLGASLLHGVDATTMKLHTDLKMRKFDRIIFNFPHAGFHGKEDNIRLIKMHRRVVHGFFRNASGMLRANGEIHVNHKTTTPFNRWCIKELASQNSLAFIECVDFKAEDYPGYNNKRGDGLKSDDPFPLGACGTYKFRFSPHTKKMPKVLSSLDIAHITFQNFVETPFETGRQPILPYEFRQPIVPSEFQQHQMNFTAYANNIPGYVESPPTTASRDEFSRIFQGYFSHVTETFGWHDCDVYNSVHEALNLGFATYMAGVPGRDLNGYIELLEELHHLSVSRLAWLQTMLVSDHQW